MQTVDLHTHTRFFHSNPGEPTWYDPLGARLLKAAAHWRGLDGVALTNHDYYRHYDRSEHVESIPGIEITTTSGDVLVIGPDPPTHTDPGKLTPGEAADLAHDRGCAAILAHPYREGTVAESNAPLDAVEVNGKHPRHRARVERLAERLDLPLVGGSDAHFPIEVGRAYTALDTDTLSPTSVVEAIEDGRVSPRVDDRPSNRVVQRAYRIVHRIRHGT